MTQLFHDLLQKLLIDQIKLKYYKWILESRYDIKIEYFISKNYMSRSFKMFAKRRTMINFFWNNLQNT